MSKLTSAVLTLSSLYRCIVYIFIRLLQLFYIQSTQQIIIIIIIIILLLLFFWLLQLFYIQYIQSTRQIIVIIIILLFFNWENIIIIIFIIIIVVVVVIIIITQYCPCHRGRYLQFLSRVSILLLTRDIDIVILSVRPSVRLSVCP